MSDIVERVAKILWDAGCREDHDIRLAFASAVCAATIEECLDIVEQENQKGGNIWDIYVAIRALKEQP